METGNVEMLASAAQELVAMRAREPLRRLTEHEDAHVRESAFSALAKIAEPTDATRFIAGLADTPLQADEICRDALLSMGSEALKQVGDLVARSHEGNIPLSAIELLGMSGDPEMVPTLRDALKSSDATVRQWVVEALIEIGGPAAVEVLREHAALEPEAEIRELAAGASAD